MVAWSLESRRSDASRKGQKVGSRRWSRWQFAGDFELQSNAVIGCYLVSVTFAYFLFLYLYNPTLFYNPIGWLDPFVYVGYGLYYGYSDFSDWYYKASRLPWNFLEFTARHIFRPQAAAFFLQFASFSLMSISVFLYFRRLISQSNALLLAVVSIFFPLFPASGGADYHNTIAAPLYFLMLALFAVSIAERSLIFAGWGGAAAALTLHTLPLIALLGPGLALHWLVCCWSHKRTFIFGALGVSVVGFAAATIGLGVISAAFGRNFFFFMPQLNFVLWIGNNNPWWRPFSLDWLAASKSNAYLVGIFVICLVELVILTARRRLRDERVAASAYAGYVVSYLLAVALEFKGQTILQADYMALMLVVATFLPIGYLMERYLPPLSSRGRTLLVVIFPTACAVLLFGSGSIYASLKLYMLAPFTVAVLALAGVYIVLIVFSTTRLNLAVVLLPMLIAALIPDLGSYKYDACRSTERLNVFISDASTFLTGVAGDPQLVHLFADPNESMTRPCFRDLRVFELGLSLMEVGHSFIGDPFHPKRFDELTINDFSDLVTEKGILALLAVQDETKDRLLTTAEKVGLDLQLVGLLPDSSSGVKLYLFRPGRLAALGH